MKRLFVLHIGHYRPELCRLTLPTIRAWAEANGWEYHEINRRMFDRKFVPITGEKMQIRHLIEGCEWAMHVDADVMLRPDTPDPSKRPPCVFSSYETKAETLFQGLRGRGLSGGYYGAHKDFFSLWDHPENASDWVQAVAACERPHIIDEYLISRNFLRMNINLEPACLDVDAYVRHFGSELVQGGVDHGVAQAEAVWQDWSYLWKLPPLGT